MNRYYYVLVVGLSVTGCMSPNGTPDRTASGALTGGVTGALLGSLTPNHRAGAAVGGAVGAVVGGLIGHRLDQAQAAQLTAQSPQTLQRLETGDPLTVQDVKALVNAGVGDDLIMSQIRNSRTIYHLSTADIIDLNNSGAGDKLIDFMINTPSQVTSASVLSEVGRVPPAPLSERRVACPGPGYVWTSGAWIWRVDHWFWHGGYWHRAAHPGPPRW